MSYKPFGERWKREMMKLTKKELVNMLQRKLPEANRYKEALEKWREWEAELLNTPEVWFDGLPKFTQEIQDKYIEVQTVREQALKGALHEL